MKSEVKISLVFIFFLVFLLFFLSFLKGEGYDPEYYTVNCLNDSSTSKELQFSTNENKTVWIRLPKYAHIVHSTLNLSGEFECTSCSECTYDPGTGPDCSCPSPGSGGSCPGGCSQCAYTPSPSGSPATCTCTSPYTGGSCASCDVCLYTPSCPCSCTSPYSGGGVYQYSNTYSCSGSWSDSGGGTKTLPSGVDSWSCSATCSASVNLPTDSYASEEVYVETAICSGSASCYGNEKTNAFIYTPSGGTGMSSCYDCSVSYGCAAYNPFGTSLSQNCGSYSCSQGETIGCFGLHSPYTVYTDSSCSAGPVSGTYSHSCSASWSYQKTLIQTSSCPGGGCVSGDSQTGCSPSCYSCHSCSYTPTPSNSGCHSCPSPGSGTPDCTSCDSNSCTYTPTGPDCSCPSPGSGGSCPGGCSQCSYIPNLPSCSCTSPYTGGGCASGNQPTNPWLDSTDNGRKEWQLSGAFNESNSPVKVDLNSTEMTEYLKTCSADSNGNCDVPIKIHSDTAGNITIDDINVTYELQTPLYYYPNVNYPSTYSSTPTNFSILWEPRAGDMELSLVETNFTGLKNYTMNLEWQNDTHSFYDYLITLPVGTFSYKFYGNNSVDRWNSTDVNIFTINKATPSISLSYKNITYEQNEIINCSTNNIDSTANLTLWLDNTLLAFNQSSSPIINYTLDSLDWGANTYTLTCNISTTQNFTSYSISKSFRIYKKTPTVYLALNGTQDDVIYEPKSYANFTAWTDAVYPLTVNLNSNYTGWSLQSGLEPLQNISYLIRTGTWNLTAYTNGDQNYSSSSVTHYFTVGPYKRFLSQIITPIISIYRQIYLIRSIFQSVFPLPETKYGYVEKTEGPYTPVECSEWGTSGIHRCVQECPSCYSELGYKVRWKKTIVLDNIGAVSPITYKLNASIPKSTVSDSDIELRNSSNEICPLDEVNISEGWATWIIDVPPGENIYTLNLNTTPPEISSYNETEGIEQTIWINLTGASDLTYEKIWTYKTLTEPTINVKLYDNTTGSMNEVTSSSDWGPPATADLDGSGYADFYKWITPKIQAGETKKLVIQAIVGKVLCEVIDKEIENAPITAGDNVEWKWTINCTNSVEARLHFSTKVRIPLESSRLILDGNPIEAGFYTLPPYGPYVALEGILDPYTSNLYELEFRTPPVTAEVSPPRFPEKFWVGEKSPLALDISVKNWASENISAVEKNINIKYGEDLKVYEKGYLIDSVDIVKGYYTLNITNISAYETRSYTIVYKILTADATIQRYGRKMTNGTQYLFYPVKIRSLSDFPLSPLYIRFRHENPYTCKDVAFVWLTDKEKYLNPPEGSELEFYCSGNDTIVRLADLPGPGEEEYFDVFVVEIPKPPTPINDIIYNFFESLIRIIQNFINWLVGLLT